MRPDVKESPVRPALVLSGLALAAAALVTAPAFAQDSGPQDGAAMFAANCSACHQDHGQGIPGAFPALAGNTFVQGPADLVAKTVINGRGGMPSFRNDLKDDQIAAILSFVRQAWGNKAGPIAAADVAAVRSPDASESHAASLQAH